MGWLLKTADRKEMETMRKEMIAILNVILVVYC